MLTPGPPLQPSGEEGRRLLRDELVHGEYHRRHVLQRLLAWLGRRLEGGVGAASGAGWVTTLVTMLIGAVLVTGLILILSRVRRDLRERAGPQALLPDDRPSSGELRLRAEEALAAGRYADAVIDGFRALAVRQVERGRLQDLPGATAHEVAADLATSYPPHGDRVGRTADLFDATLYGDHPAGPQDAAAVLDLDDALSGAR
jgi:hypothetical protein